MVLAYHAIFTAYGFWLPNDPRGSWSDWIRQWELVVAGGAATKTDERRSLAHDPHDHDRRRAAKRALRYDPVRFTGEQAASIARGFRHAIDESGYVPCACSILPGHVHAVIGRDGINGRPVERIVGHLKARATQALVEDGLHPFARFRDAGGRFPSVRAHREWKVFLNDVRQTRGDRVRRGEPSEGPQAAAALVVRDPVRRVAPPDAPRERGR